MVECADPLIASFIEEGGPGSYRSESWNVIYRSKHKYWALEQKKTIKTL